ncbi:7TM diverse intracellular signaling domain protein [Leptospira interrogans serovar Bataviae str. HAI135]|nr:7TM diverse intracellular signaling domain protein [Leptospira interrogans serovar Bataviae str. HAI135]
MDFFHVFSFYIYLRSNAVYELDLDPLLQMKLEYMVIFNITSLFLLFLNTFFQYRLSFISKLYQIFTLVLTLLIPFSNRSDCLFLLKIWQFSIFIFIIYSFFIMYQSLIRKNPDAIRMIFGFWF